MDRREALKTSSLILGYAVTAGTAAAVLNGCSVDKAPDWVPVNLTSDQVKLVAEIAEIIIPATETPGAKEAMVDRFVDSILDCYPQDKSDQFKLKLDNFMAQLDEQHGKPFHKLPSETQIQLVDELVKQSKEKRSSNFYAQLKEWTVTGYCTSEVGATQHLMWDPVPGAPYQGCIDFSEVGKTWAIR